MIGTIKYFDLKSRRGWVRSDDDGAEYAVRGSDFPDPLRPLRQGTRVAFELRAGTKRVRKLRELS
jgi:cold shock CspA family protein